MIRVVIADDNPVVRSGLTALLEAGGDVTVVGEAGDGKHTIELTERLRPDLVLLDVRMPLMDGVTALGRLSSMARVLMLTYTDDAEVVRTAVRDGASGYLVHGTFTATELAEAVRNAAEGTANPLSPAAVSALVDAVRGEQGPSGEHSHLTRSADHRSRYGLSAREAEIMDLIARGNANREIAGSLFLAEKTVKNHVNRIFAKLSVDNRAAAVARWLGTAADGR